MVFVTLIHGFAPKIGILLMNVRVLDLLIFDLEHLYPFVRL